MPVPTDEWQSCEGKTDICIGRYGNLWLRGRVGRSVFHRTADGTTVEVGSVNLRHSGIGFFIVPFPISDSERDTAVYVVASRAGEPAAIDPLRINVVEPCGPGVRARADATYEITASETTVPSHADRQGRKYSGYTLVEIGIAADPAQITQCTLRFADAVGAPVPDVALRMGSYSRSFAGP
ncbi:MAG: hypothetical protein ACM30I_08960 [Gemmatimonas sp.]